VIAEGERTGAIDRGLLVYLGISAADTSADAERIAEKIATLRIFEDDEGKLNRDVQDVRGGVLAISNFTLLADARKGRRPSFDSAATAQAAEPLYNAFIAALKAQGCNVAAGAFGKHMDIRSVADGPVNLIVEFPPPANAGGE
jgi:D-tyrosyl-tRNA(Tyr) deacylase